MSSMSEESNFVEKKYEVCVFTTDGKVYLLNLTLQEFKQLKKATFPDYSQELNSTYVVITGKNKASCEKYQKKIANHFVYCDDDGISKGLPVNKSVSFRQKHIVQPKEDVPYSIVKVGSKTHRDFEKLPLVLKPLLGTVITLQMGECNDDEL